MKRLYIGLLALFMVGGLTGCSVNNENSNVKTDEISTPTKPGHDLEPSEDIKPTSPVEPTKPVEPTSPVEPSKPVEPTEDIKPSTPDTTIPEVVAKEVSLSEAKRLALTNEASYKESFNEAQAVKITGTVILDFTISGNYHLMVLSDGEEILPIAINANATTLNKYKVGGTYMVEGICGSYRNQPCVRVINNPTRADSINVNIEALADDSTIAKLFDVAYSLEAKENNCNIATNILKINATYVARINENLMLAFDGERPLIIHTDNGSNSGFIKGDNYDFYLMASVFKGKRGAELIRATKNGGTNSDYLNEIKASAEPSNINTLSQIDRYNDNKSLYPHIFRADCYIGSNVIDGKHHLALIDSPDTKIKYEKGNDRPFAIYAKNHVVNDFNAEYSNLVPYYNNEAIGSFYFVVTEYQSSYHCFQAFIIDELTAELA